MRRGRLAVTNWASCSRAWRTASVRPCLCRRCDTDGGSTVECPAHRGDVVLADLAGSRRRRPARAVPGHRGRAGQGASRSDTCGDRNRRLTSAAVSRSRDASTSRTLMPAGSRGRRARRRVRRSRRTSGRTGPRLVRCWVSSRPATSMRNALPTRSGTGRAQPPIGGVDRVEIGPDRGMCRLGGQQSGELMNPRYRTPVRQARIESQTVDESGSVDSSPTLALRAALRAPILDTWLRSPT